MKIERIDPHVHCRDGKQNYKSTINRVFQVAGEQGVKTIFDMPNTDPPITNEDRVKERLLFVPNQRKKNYFLWVGLTADVGQIEKAVTAWGNFRQVIGLKLFTIESGSRELAVDSLEKQKIVYETLVEIGYAGVLAVHCEKKDYLKPELWIPHNPTSHSLARPKEAEIESIRDQIRLANQTGFKGMLHIVHVSCPESVELIRAAKKNLKITCGVTPHHLLYSQEMQIGKWGMCCKTNPPLRRLEDVEALRYCLLRGEIDWIETDHAPHPLEQKIFPPYASGFPSLFLYKYLVEEFLPSVGATKSQIDGWTYGNIMRVFGEKIGG